MMLIKRRLETYSQYTIVNGSSKTEVGLATPIRKLYENYIQGKDVPKLAANIPFSVPTINHFSVDLVDMAKLNKDMQLSIQKLRDNIPKA